MVALQLLGVATMPNWFRVGGGPGTVPTPKLTLGCLPMGILWAVLLFTLFGLGVAVIRASI